MSDSLSMGAERRKCLKVIFFGGGGLLARSENDRRYVVVNLLRVLGSRFLLENKKRYVVVNLLRAFLDPRAEDRNFIF